MCHNKTNHWLQVRIRPMVGFLIQGITMSIFDAQAEIRKFQTLNFGQVNATVLQVNQDVARFLLSKNTPRNRRISQSRVKSYRREMEHGQWTIGDPIKFTQHGELIDGQHRLAAVDEEMVVPMTVLVGLPDVAAETLDQGIRRSALHIAQFRGVADIDSHVVAAFRMMLYFRCNGSSNTSTFMTSRQIITCLQKYQNVHEAIIFAKRYCKKSFGLRLASVIGAVARAKLSDYPLSDSDLDYFLYCFQTGKQLDYPKTAIPRSGDAACVLRNHCLDLKSKSAGKAAGAAFRDRLFLIAQSALIAYKEQRKVSYFKEQKKNCFPVPLLDNLNPRTLEFDLV